MAVLLSSFASIHGPTNIVSALLKVETQPFCGALALARTAKCCTEIARCHDAHGPIEPCGDDNDKQRIDLDDQNCNKETDNITPWRLKWDKLPLINNLVRFHNF